MKPYGRSGVVWRATALLAVLLGGGITGGCRSSGGGTGGRTPSTLPDPSAADAGPGGGGGMEVAVVRPPEGEVQWSFQIRPAKEGAVLDMTGVALVYEGAQIGGPPQRGSLVVAGPAPRSGSAAGGGFTHDYKEGVTTLTVAGHTLRLTDEGKTLAMEGGGAQTINLSGPKKVLLVRKTGKIEALAPKAAEKVLNPNAPTITPQEAYAACLRPWKAGDQREAAALLDRQTALFPRDQRLAFFRVACARSRAFADRSIIDRSYNMFASALGMGRDTPEGRAILAIMRLDTGRDVERNLTELAEIVRERPDDPILAWMLATQYEARERNKEGDELCRTLLKQIGGGGGPATLHHACADFQDGLGKHQEALGHRRTAVKLEPAAWTYDALAGTLTALRREKEAQAARARAVALAPQPPEGGGRGGFPGSPGGRPAGPSAGQGLGAGAPGTPGR